MSTAPAPAAGDRHAADHLVALSDKVADHLLARTLPKSRWTHEGHLLACISLVRRYGAADALAMMRAAIPPYNESTGVANTPTSGYHDTITVYFVWAIARLVDAGASTSVMLWHPTCEREALLSWWDRATLMSPAARAAWTPPALAGDGGEAPREWLRPDVTIRARGVVAAALTAARVDGRTVAASACRAAWRPV